MVLNSYIIKCSSNKYVTIIVVSILFLLLVYTIFMEATDRAKIQDIPDCRKMGNLCKAYNDKFNVIIREPNSEDLPRLGEHIKEALLSHKETVYWRLSLLSALLINFILQVSLVLCGISLNPCIYVIIFLTTLMISYFSRNYGDYHYDRNHRYKLYQAFSEYDRLCQKNNVL